MINFRVRRGDTLIIGIEAIGLSVEILGVELQIARVQDGPVLFTATSEFEVVEAGVDSIITVSSEATSRLHPGRYDVTLAFSAGDARHSSQSYRLAVV